MSKLITTTPEHTPDEVEQPPNQGEHVCRPLVVVTAQQVKMATAAAIGLPRKSLTQRVVAALLHPSDRPPLKPRHYPPRRAQFLEDAAMQREMLRL